MKAKELEKGMFLDRLGNKVLVVSVEKRIHPIASVETLKVTHKSKKFGTATIDYTPEKEVEIY